VSVKTVSAWECGKAPPSMPNRAKLAKWLEVE
jgi:transcriptional regulator with XRE-family HTH domain